MSCSVEHIYSVHLVWLADVQLCRCDWWSYRYMAEAINNFAADTIVALPESAQLSALQCVISVHRGSDDKWTN